MIMRQQNRPPFETKSDESHVKPKPKADTSHFSIHLHKMSGKQQQQQGHSHSHGQTSGSGSGQAKMTHEAADRIAQTDSAQKSGFADRATAAAERNEPTGSRRQ
jgi:hypothetical protein